ncbi:hypothetical protein M501DRAFT_1004314 [Patellaria atrata CBS 101060]|uniref:Uncharacterized protein n=1 Tax=Patellaria atrata CBS 101060 TaxID=1346257 RepID=A0A9P4S9J6_9PEZI|nr:hypothetical protein M501DRAFT_1004314 [Patellaria atrata CBS 101060]
MFLSSFTPCMQKNTKVITRATTYLELCELNVEDMSQDQHANPPRVLFHGPSALGQEGTPQRHNISEVPPANGTCLFDKLPNELLDRIMGQVVCEAQLPVIPDEYKPLMNAQNREPKLMLASETRLVALVNKRFSSAYSHHIEKEVHIRIIVPHRVSATYREAPVWTIPPEHMRAYTYTFDLHMEGLWTAHRPRDWEQDVNNKMTNVLNLSHQLPNLKQLRVNWHINTLEEVSDRELAHPLIYSARRRVCNNPPTQLYSMIIAIAKTFRNNLAMVYAFKKQGRLWAPMRYQIDSGRGSELDRYSHTTPQP